MNELILCLQWFCYGFTSITLFLVGFILFIAFFAERQTKKRAEEIRKMMTKDSNE